MSSGPRTPRRSWDTDFKKRVVAEASRPGVSAAQVARRHGLNANLLFNWKKKFGSGGQLVPVDVVTDQHPIAVHVSDTQSTIIDNETDVTRSGWIEIDLPCGTRLRCRSDMEPVSIARIIAGLKGKP
ncbi:MAG: transposase [Hyphomicrobiales bacterium]|nr:transposase [Hyphomicrobiales bacterium]